MPTLSAQFALIPPAGETAPALTDLAVFRAGGTDFLYGTTRAGGSLSAWSLAGGQIALIDRDALAGAPTPGAMPGLALVAGDLLTVGGAGGQMALRDLGVAGQIDSAVSAGTETVFSGPLGDLATLPGASGGTLAYGTVDAGRGLALMQFDADGALVRSREWVTPPLTTAEVDGAAFVFAAYGSDPDRGLTAPGLRAWSVSANGNVVTADTLTAEDNLWISAPPHLPRRRRGIAASSFSPARARAA